MIGIDSRRDLIYALSEAAAIEHALLCQYLFAGYSIRRSPAADVPATRLKDLQSWAGTVLLVAREEMEHLGTVCNLLASIGAAPNFRRPNFPQPTRYFGEIAAFSLERFSFDTVRRFAEFEKPEFLHLRETIIRLIETYGGGPRDDLDIVMETIGVDGLWDYGESWILAGDELEFATVWTGRRVSRRVDELKERALQGSPDAARDVMARLIQEAYASRRWISEAVDPQAGMDAPAEEDTPADEPVVEGASTALGAAAGRGGLNAAAAVPIIIGDRVRAVVAFLYRTYHHAHEDDDYVNTVFDALNEGPDETNRLARLLRRHNVVKSMVATASTDGRGLMPDRLDFSTIGGFYRQIRKGFLALGTDPFLQLFIGPVDAQITSKEIGLPFPGWHNVDPGRISDLTSALKAIDQIIVEGEGAPGHNATSHYGRFLAIADELGSALADDPAFEPAAPVASNPVVRLHSDIQPEVFLFEITSDVSTPLDRGTLPPALVDGFLKRANITLAIDARVDVVEKGIAWRITDPRGRQVFSCRRAPKRVDVYQTITRLESEFAVDLADLFNAAYEVMLLMLIRLYAHTDESADDLKMLAGIAFLPLMTQVLRPLTEMLMEAPATPRYPALRAGPTFEIYHDLRMLPHRDGAWVIFHERMQDIADECGRLAGLTEASPRMPLLHRNVARLADRLGEIAAAKRPS